MHSELSYLNQPEIGRNPSGSQLGPEIKETEYSIIMNQKWQLVYANHIQIWLPECVRTT